MQNPRLIVRSHQPRRLWILRSLAVAGVMILAFGIFEFGHMDGGFQRMAAVRDQSVAQATIDDLEQENARLRDRIALVQTSRDIDSQAYKQVESHLTELQAQILEQREELEFYRGIVSPADGASGLKIQEFKIMSGAESSLYRLRLVLVQAMKHDRRVSGVVKLSIDGARDGQPIRFSLGELTPEAAGGGPLAYSFRYFQDFEHDVILPTGFVPDRVNIEVSPKGRSARTIRRSYDWTVNRG